MCGGAVFFPHINNNTSNTYENLLYLLFCAWLIFFSTISNASLLLYGH